MDGVAMFFGQSSSFASHDSPVNQIEENLTPKQPLLPTSTLLSRKEHITNIHFLGSLQLCY